MTTTRCFVTGGAGFIGSHLTDALLARGHQVTVYDDLSLGRKEHLTGALAAGARLVQADLLDLDRLTTEMAGHQQVWHLAANSDIRQGTRSTRLDLEQGTLATYNVLEAMRRCDASSIAFASSSVVYGEPTVLPTPEDHGPLCPISLYGAAKLAAEGLITAFAHCHGPMTAHIFRFANIVGPRSTHGILVDLARKLRRSPEELEVLGDGQQRKSYLTVDDCVAAMLFALETAREPVNIFNLGSGDNVTVDRIARLIVKHWTGGRARIRYTGGQRGWAGDVPLMQLDPSRLASLGWRASRSSEQAMEQVIVGMKDTRGTGNSELGTGAIVDRTSLEGHGCNRCNLLERGPMSTTTMGVKLDEETRNRLKLLGEARKRTPHWLMKSAILEYLEKEEAYEAEKREDKERWARYQQTGDAISNDEMMSWLVDLERER